MVHSVKYNLSSSKITRIIYFIPFLILLMSCNVPDKKKIDINTPKFSTSDASELFFRNVRQIYYDKEELPGPKLVVYRFQERNSNVDYPHMNPTIIINWRHDESYVIIEPNDILGNDPIVIKWVSAVNGSSGTYSFLFGDKSSHFTFACQIYLSLDEGHKLFLLSNNEEREILFLKKDKEAFRKTVKDYLRLVDIL